MATILVPATGALGHATLTETEPVDGAVLEEAPTEVVFRFNEPVSADPAAVRVFDSSGERVDRGDGGGSGTEIVTTLRDGLGDGTYVATFRVVSLDGHPIQGAMVFQVGTGGEVEDSVLADLIDGGASSPWTTAGLIARWLSYVAVLVVAGGMAFQVLVAEAGSTRLLLVAASVGLVASLASLFIYGAEVTGLGWEAVTDGEVLGRTLGGSFGVAAVVRIGALAAFLILGLARYLSPPWAGLVVGTIALGSFLLTGHTLTSEPAAVRIAADVIHLGGAAVWVGGLAMLTGALRRRSGETPDRAAFVVSRFSSLAAITVLLLALAGLALTWVEVRAVRAIDTPYGWTLVAKVILVMGVLAIAAYNRRRLVPAVADSADAVTARRRLGRTLMAELAGVVLVLLATALLVGFQPAREAAGIDGPLSVYQPIGDEGWQMNVVVDPNRAGVNDIHLYLLSGAGRPLQAPQDLILELSLPEEGIGPVVREPEPAGPAHWILTGPELAFPGEWKIIIRLIASESEEMRAELSLPVKP